MPKVTLYYPENKKRILDKASEILKRDNSSLSKFLIKKAEEYNRLHEPGNPQQLLERFDKSKPYIAPKKCHMERCPSPATCVCEWVPTGTLYACCRVHADGHVRGNPVHWKLRSGSEVSR